MNKNYRTTIVLEKVTEYTIIVSQLLPKCIKEQILPIIRIVHLIHVRGMEKKRVT